MKYQIIGAASIAAVALVGIANTSAVTNTGGGHEQRGPDVVCWFTGGGGNLDMELYGSADGINSFAFGTTSCNFGDMVADWYSGTNRVPVIAQTCYRLKDGRFEQIATAWLKHSFCAVSEPGCGDCQATNCSTLGIGCADTYWAGLNADAIAPRSAINAFTGYYDYPFSIYPSGPSSMRGKLQFNIEDIEPTLNADALYFLEGQYVSPDDAEWGNLDNNASYKWIYWLSAQNPQHMSTTQVGDPAIFAWPIFDPEVDLRPLRVPDEGLLHVGVRVFDNEDGTWRYEYAIHNLNSDRSIDSFSIPLGDCVEVSDIGFHDVNHASGEVIDGTDWAVAVSPTEISWSTNTYDENEWANAIRWGSMYNFYFTANEPPSDVALTLGLFKPGDEPSVEHVAAAPACQVACEGDVDGSGSVGISDMLQLIGDWGSDNAESDINGDGQVDVTDLLLLVGNWGCS